MKNNFDYLKNMLDPNLQAVYYDDDNTEQFLGMYDKSENKFYPVYFYEDYDPDCPEELKGLDNVSLYNFYTERIYDSPDISLDKELGYVITDVELDIDEKERILTKKIYYLLPYGCIDDKSIQVLFRIEEYPNKKIKTLLKYLNTSNIILHYSLEETCAKKGAVYYLLPVFKKEPELSASDSLKLEDLTGSCMLDPQTLTPPKDYCTHHHVVYNNNVGVITCEHDGEGSVKQQHVEWVYAPVYFDDITTLIDSTVLYPNKDMSFEMPQNTTMGDAFKLFCEFVDNKGERGAQVVPK